MRACSGSWYGSATAQRLHCGTKPQSRHWTNEAVPRRFRKRITCSRASSACWIAPASEREKMPRFPAFNSSRRSTTSAARGGGEPRPRQPAKPLGRPPGVVARRALLLLVRPLVLLVNDHEAQVRLRGE